MSLVPQYIFWAANRLQSTSLPEAFALCSGAQNGFYNLLQSNSGTHSFEWVKSSRESALTNFTAIESLFNLINTGFLCLSAKALLSGIQSKSAITLLHPSHPLIRQVASPALLAAAACLAAKALLYSFKAPAASIPLTAPSSPLSVSLTRSFAQRWAQTIHVAQLITQTCLIGFSRDSSVFLFNLAGLAFTSYNIFKNHELKWITLSKTIDSAWSFPTLRVEKIKFTFELPSLPAAPPAHCTDCPNSTPSSPLVSYCMDSAFHPNCLATFFNQCLERRGTTQLRDGTPITANLLLLNSDPTQHQLHHTRNGAHLHTTYSYSLSIPRDKIPHCPHCDQVPPFLDFSAQLIDLCDKEHPVRIIDPTAPTDSAPLFEKLYAIYSVVQAGIAYFQRYPELAYIVFKIQKISLVFDVIGLMSTGYFLIKKMKEQKKISNPTALAAGTLIGAFTLGATALLGVRILNASLLPSIPLNEVLKALPIPAERLAEMRICWDSALVTQSIYAARILSSLAFSYFSTKPRLSLISAASQSFSLFSLSQLRWIALTQTILSPAKRLALSESSLRETSNLKSLTVNTSFQVDPSCIHDPAKIQSIVGAIYQYVDSLFHNSSWSRTLWITMKGAREVSRKMHYYITLGARAMNPFESLPELQLDRLTLRGVDAIYPAEVSIR